MNGSTSSVLRAAVGAVLADGVAAAVAFGAQLSAAQQERLLSFAGSATSLIFVVYAIVHVKHGSQAVALATAAPTPPSGAQTVDPSASVPPGGGGG